jgi:hypothetical protein
MMGDWGIEMSRDKPGAAVWTHDGAWGEIHGHESVLRRITEVHALHAAALRASAEPELFGAVGESKPSDKDCRFFRQILLGHRGERKPAALPERLAGMPLAAEDGTYWGGTECDVDWGGDEYSLELFDQAVTLLPDKTEGKRATQEWLVEMFTKRKNADKETPNV